MRSLLSLVLLAATTIRAATASYDVVVYGGTSGGIAAVIQTARMGKTAVLIEPTQFLGGLTTGGLGATDIGNKRAIGGIRYNVLVAYPWNANRAGNVPVVIKHADGEARVALNQKKKPVVQEVLHAVGTFRFEKGKAGYVEISNAGTDGFVAIDAVQWIEAKP